MKISEFSVRHSLLVNLISVLVLLAGLYILFIYKIRKEAFPEVNYDIVLIQTVYPGASPAEVEKLVTVPLEKEIKGVDGIEKMRSASLEDVSTVYIEISSDVKNKRKVIDDVRQAVDRVTDFPKETEDPIITEVTTGEMPVVEIALSGDVTEFELQHFAELLEDVLEDVPGVSSIAREGWRDQEVWVEVDPAKMQKYRLSLEEVMQALRTRNMNIPGGKIRADKEFSIRTTGEFYDREEIENVVIRANDLGNWLRVKDVAKVRFAFEDEVVIKKSFGTRSILLTVIKRSSADAIKVVNGVRRKADVFVKNLDPRLKVAYVDDITFYIKRRLGVLRNNGIIGLFLVSLVLMIFLDKRVAFLTALGIPIAFSATLAAMSMFDISVNLVSMFGLIIVLGMLVDDGIIVAENCSRYLESGLKAHEAAVKGTQEVVKPVTTTIITTVAAFSPLMFLSGMMGKFIWGIPVVVIIALSASLFEALVILPSHFADFVKVKKGTAFVSKKELPWFKKLISFYTRTITRALHRRYWVMLGVVVLLVLTGLLASKMKFILFGGGEIEQFYVRAEAPVGTNLYATEKLLRQVEEKVALLSSNEVEAYTTDVGTIGQTWMFDPYGKQGSHVGQVTVYTTEEKKRKRSIDEMVESLRDELKDAHGFEKLYFEKEQSGPPIGKPIALQIRGESFEVLDEISQKVISYLKSIDGVKDIVCDYEVGRGELRVEIDEDKASSDYLSVSEIASSIRSAFRGGIATSIKPTKAEEEIDVLVRFPEQFRNSREGFENILIPNRFGNLIPLLKVARIKKGLALASILHLDGKRVVTVRADLDTNKITSLEANKMVSKEFKDIPKEYPGYSMKPGGEQEENERTTKDFVRAFLLAFFLIFMILAVSFNSLMQPFIVMLAIPFGIIGVIWSFFFHGLPISFFMMMGSVALIGIVVNDSIVLVEFINNLRRQGAGRRDSIIRAGQLRLRPVLLTTITTACGLTPTAYGIWGNDPFLRPMALTIVWGIVCATAMTLIVIPCVYAIIDDITLRFSGHTTVTKSKFNNNHAKEEER